MWKTEETLSINGYSDESEKTLLEFDLFENKDTLVFKKGQVVYFEGSSPQGIYLIKKGKVKVSKSSCGGRDFITHIATEGDILSYGDLALNSRHSGSGVALEETIIFFIYKRDFQEALKEHPEFFEHFLDKMIIYVRQMEAKASQIAYKPVRGRLADALLYLDTKFNGMHQDASEISINRKDLAGLIGTVRETVNRLLSEFRADGWIDTDGHKIHILDQKALKKTSQMYN
ncbi:Crp/Fnr family transcriptional regulator [Gaetbulibacter aestuarii]|uniref:Crp/Fnr family transcriptional regulator n=1 Tax=Gaetbulibacter aestuarii TaxID=1502358 RepID=A0ABW7MYY9_9FLAO